MHSAAWQVMGAKEELRTAVAWAAHSLHFDIDRRVHVFELTIRALGGLLSAHALIDADPSLVPGGQAVSTSQLVPCKGARVWPVTKARGLQDRPAHNAGVSCP